MSHQGNDQAREQAFERLYEELDREPTNEEVTDFLDSQEDYYCSAGSDGYIPS